MYKRIMLIIAVLGLIGGVFAYGMSRDMDLRTVEVEVKELKTGNAYMIKKLDDIYLYLINKREPCPKSDKKEGK